MHRSPFSLTGLLIGAALCVGIGLLGPWGIAFNYFWLGFNPSSPGALFFFFCMSFVVNGIFRGLRLGSGLSRADLVLIYCMLMMAVTVPTWGLISILIGTLVYPFYYASPENNYSELFFDSIPSWIVPQDFDAIKGYYEGLSKGETIPWEAWVEPLSHWLAFALALGFMLICLSTLLHRQWSVHERLTYPMVQLPQNMIDMGESESRLAPFFRNRWMWLGFLIPFAILSFNAFSHYYPFISPIQFSGSIPLFDQLQLPFKLVLAWVGFFYLVNLEITFSIWFFYILSKIEEGLFGRLGIISNQQLSAYEYSQPPDITHQGTGAVVVLVLVGLWTARIHLLEVARKLWKPDRGVDDSEELLRYRTTLGGFLTSLIFLGGWLWRSGVPALIVPVLLVISVIFFILVARVVAAGGVASARSPIVPAYFIISGMGTSILGVKGLVALNFSFIWQGESRTSPMVACANGLKLAEIIPGSKTRLFWGLMLALLCSMLGAIYITMELAYTYGAMNLSLIHRAGYHGWPHIGATIVNMPDASLRGWLFTGIGGGAQVVLIWAQHRWFWWPFHPIGFAIAVGWLTSQIWPSALVAWLLKLVILRFGGVHLFQIARPFFLGLILGEVSVQGFWALIYPFTAEKGLWLTWM